MEGLGGSAGGSVSGCATHPRAMRAAQTRAARDAYLSGPSYRQAPTPRPQPAPREWGPQWRWGRRCRCMRLNYARLRIRTHIHSHKRGTTGMPRQACAGELGIFFRLCRGCHRSQRSPSRLRKCRRQELRKRAAMAGLWWSWLRVTVRERALISMCLEFLGNGCYTSPCYM